MTKYICQNQFFGLMCDESTDRGCEKQLVILVRVFDNDQSKPTTRFLAMPTCNIGSADNIYQCIKSTFRYLHVHCLFNNYVSIV